jgi:hypothetical protein
MKQPKGGNQNPRDGELAQWSNWACTVERRNWVDNGSGLANVGKEMGMVAPRYIFIICFIRTKTSKLTRLR